ncbi:MAG: alpha/beta hydrolase [Bacteroidota bacterium]
METAEQRKQSFADSGQRLDLPELGGHLYFRRSGTGPRLLLALHGFGLDGSIFASLASQIDEDTHTLIAPDMPGHGQTKWSKPAFTASDFVDVLEKLIGLQPTEYVHLIGFSYGGRISTKLIAGGLLPMVDKLSLMAPDGYGGKYTKWIDSWLGFSLHWVAKLVGRPKPWLWLARILARVKIINPFALQFVKWQLGDAKSRQRLQLTLRSMHEFRLRQTDYNALDSWASRGKSASVSVGLRDQVVNRKGMEEIVRSMPNVSWYTHKGGHWPDKGLFDRS